MEGAPTGVLQRPTTLQPPPPDQGARMVQMAKRQHILDPAQQTAATSTRNNHYRTLTMGWIPHIFTKSARKRNAHNQRTLAPIRCCHPLGLETRRHPLRTHPLGRIAQENSEERQTLRNKHKTPIAKSARSQTRNLRQMGAMRRSNSPRWLPKQEQSARECSSRAKGGVA